jgi:hypothetical protein
MFGGILGVAIGIGAILLGIKGFTRDGLPFTKSKRITGTSAKVVGVICILVGLALIAADVYPLLRTP